MDSDHDAPEGVEVAALRELIASDGWKRFAVESEKEWGDSACIRKITAALSRLPPGDDDAERQTSVQILAAQREVRKLLAWPSARLSQLRTPKAKRGPMETLRRIARP